MPTFMSWLFHRGRTNGGSGEVTRTSRPLLEDLPEHVPYSGRLTNHEDTTAYAESRTFRTPYLMPVSGRVRTRSNNPYGHTI